MNGKQWLEKFYACMFGIWRPRRLRRLQRTLGLSPAHILLDVGGYPCFWLDVPQFVRRIDTLNLHEVEWDAAGHPGFNIRTLMGDGRKLDFPDKAYDVVHSNSVIEHVGIRTHQQRFAEEIRRVGRAVWVQTPARCFFVEPHYVGMFIHWVPPGRVQKKLIRWFSLWGLMTRPTAEQISCMVDGIRLLTHSEMQTLFPDCRILVERFWGIIPKSYIAVRRAED